MELSKQRTVLLSTKIFFALKSFEIQWKLADLNK